MPEEDVNPQPEFEEEAEIGGTEPSSPPLRSSYNYQDPPFKEGGFITTPKNLDPVARQTNTNDSPLTPDTNDSSQYFRSGPTPRPAEPERSEPSRQTGQTGQTGDSVPTRPVPTSGNAHTPSPQPSPPGTTAAPTSAPTSHLAANPANQPQPSLFGRLRKGVGNIRNRGKQPGSATTQPQPNRPSATGKSSVAGQPGQSQTGKVGEKVGEAVQDVKTAATIARAAAGDVTAMAKLASNPKELWRLAKSGRKQALRVYLIIALLPIFLIGSVFFVIGLILFPKQPGNRPQSSYAIGSSYGEWCDNMQPSLTLANGHTLVLPTTDGRGKIGTEDPVNEQAGSDVINKFDFWNEDHFEGLAADDSTIERMIGEGKMKTKDLRYYVVSRWPNNTRAWKYINGGPTPPRGVEGLPPLIDYWGVKVIVYNPVKKEGVVGIILESGPAPWAGVKDGKKNNVWKSAWPDGTVYNPPGYPGKTYGAPRKEWTEIPPGYTSTLPLGREKDSKGILEMLNLQESSDVIVGFVPLDQQATAEPGSLFSCVEKRPINQAEFATAYTGGSLETCQKVAKAGDAKISFQPTSDGENLKTSLMAGRSSGIQLNLKICGFLEILLGADIVNPVKISSLAGQGHASKSEHYKGKAVDIPASREEIKTYLRWIADNRTEGLNLASQGLTVYVYVDSSFILPKYSSWARHAAKHETHIHVQFSPWKS